MLDMIIGIFVTSCTWHTIQIINSREISKLLKHNLTQYFVGQSKLVQSIQSFMEITKMQT